MRSIKASYCGVILMNDFEKCLKNRRIIKTEPNSDMIGKEITNAEYDLSKAGDSLRAKDFKWPSVQAYYSMFHSAKALVLKKGYREKSHSCLLIALNELYVNSTVINERWNCPTFR